MSAQMDGRNKSLQRHSPNQNHLLAALPAADFARLLPLLELVAMPLGDMLYEPGVPLQHAWFPTTAVVSLHVVTVTGASAETSGVGAEGMVLRHQPGHHRIQLVLPDGQATTLRARNAAELRPCLADALRCTGDAIMHHPGGGIGFLRQFLQFMRDNAEGAARALGAMRALCEARGVRLLAYGALAGGFLHERWLGKPVAEVLPELTPIVEEALGDHQCQSACISATGMT